MFRESSENTNASIATGIPQIPAVNRKLQRDATGIFDLRTRSPGEFFAWTRFPSVHNQCGTPTPCCGQRHRRCSHAIPQGDNFLRGVLLSYKARRCSITVRCFYRPTQQWEYDTTRMVVKNPHTALCMETVLGEPNGPRLRVVMRMCDGSAAQRFHFEPYTGAMPY